MKIKALLLNATYVPLFVLSLAAAALWSAAMLAPTTVLAQQVPSNGSPQPSPTQQAPPQPPSAVSLASLPAPDPVYQISQPSPCSAGPCVQPLNPLPPLPPPVDTTQAFCNSLSYTGTGLTLMGCPEVGVPMCAAGSVCKVVNAFATGGTTAGVNQAIVETTSTATGALTEGATGSPALGIVAEKATGAATQFAIDNAVPIECMPGFDTAVVCTPPLTPTPSSGSASQTSTSAAGINSQTQNQQDAAALATALGVNQSTASPTTTTSTSQDANTLAAQLGGNPTGASPSSSDLAALSAGSTQSPAPTQITSPNNLQQGTDQNTPPTQNADDYAAQQAALAAAQAASTDASAQQARGAGQGNPSLFDAAGSGIQASQAINAARQGNSSSASAPSAFMKWCGPCGYWNESAKACIAVTNDPICTAIKH
jgi:hypothetical protein